MEANLSLQHLEAALMRVDVLLHREVWRWQRAGQDPTDAFRGQYVSDADASALVRRPFGVSWGQTVALSPQQEHAYADALAQVDQIVQSVVETARQQGRILRLEHLATAFGLDRFDLDTLLVCLAPTLDLSYERIYGYLQDDVTRKRPSVNLVLDLLCEPGAGRLTMLPRFADNAPLFKYHILERVTEPGLVKPPLLNRTLRVDDAIVAWLVGEYHPHTDLGAYARLTYPKVNDRDILLVMEVQSNLARVVDVRDTPLFIFYGPDRTSQEAAVRLLAARERRLLLTVDLTAIAKTDTPMLRAVRLALRDARLNDAILCLVSDKDCLADAGENAPPPEILTELCAYPDTAIVLEPKRWQPTGIERERRLLWFNFPVPSYDQREALWQHFLGQSAAVEESNIASLAGQFMLTSGQIRDAVASAVDMAVRQGNPLSRRQLFAAARSHSSPRLAMLTRKITPRYTWEDIILPEDQLALLREIVSTVWSRPLVLEKWGVGQKLASSMGVTVLFSGPPGTGKTMAADIMARELGLDLYKIDLSTVVSKYIGETEKNLEKIFKEAENSNAILFFDEADALFGKRSEVRDSHDRYANIEISYLLQRMETYDGVSILATNLRANLDEAFTRRIQFVVDFPFPEEEYRLRIWRTLFPPGVPHDPELDFSLLARRFKLAGGNIRNIIVNAAYLASSDGRQVTMKHLLHGTRRELQKMGRLIDERDLIAEHK